MKKNKKLIIIFLILFAAILVGGCSGRRLDASGWPSATLHESVAYVSYGAHVYAVDVSNGLELWRYPSEPDGAVNFYSTPAILNNDSLIAGDYSGTLHAVSLETGQSLWTNDTGSGRLIASPFVIDGTIFAPSSNQQVYAISESGDLLWDNFKAEEPIWATPITSQDCECLYVAGMDHILYSLAVNDGSVQWQTEPLGGAIVSQPAIDGNGDLYVGTFANELLSIDRSSGRINWRFPTEDWVWTSPQVANGHVIIGDLSGTLYSVNSENGTSEWTVQPGGPIIGDPWITEGGSILFATEDGLLIRVNDSGAIELNQTTDYTFYSGPIQTEDMILITSNQPDAVLIALNESGAPRWVFSPEN